jgi:hypothetical protein
MSEVEDSHHSRLCPDHRRDHVSSGACVACAQARRIAELEQTVERLTARIDELEGDDETKTTAQETRSYRSEADTSDHPSSEACGQTASAVRPVEGGG